MAKGKHEISVEELVARLSDEVKRLQENAGTPQAPLPPQLAIPVLPEGEQLLRYEQLLTNMLRKAQPTNWLGRLMVRLFPEQISHNLLTIETLTNLFETYRALMYECINMKRELAQFRHMINEGIATDLQRDFVVFQQDNEKRSRWLEEMVRGFTREQSTERSRIEGLVREHSAASKRLEEIVQTFTQEQLDGRKRLEESVHELAEKQAHRRELTEIEMKLHRSLIARRLGSAPTNDRAASPPANGHDEQLDAFYVEFENRFRGSREEVTRRLRIWLPVMEKALLAGEIGIIDLGCGRGEWLELVRERGHTGIGIDMNPCMIELCVALGLDARQDDALAFLRSVPDATQSLITGFHIIEHLPFPIRRQILGEVFRVLRPGGAALFETPNPSNVLVGSHTFYTDYTHLQPLPPAATQFLFESLGFAKVEIKEVNPITDTARVPGTGETLRDRFNQYFYGPQDYAVIAWKPAGGAA
jgi:O-antigen chain-terminating methyltransferase